MVDSTLDISKLSKQFTQPVYFVEISFNNPLRFSTLKDSTLNGDQFIEGSVDVSIDKSGGSITLQNIDRQIIALAINEGLRNKKIKIWIEYEGTSKLLIDGLTTGGSISDSASIKFVRSQPKTIPNKRILPSEGFNHLIKPGEKIQEVTNTIGL